MCDCQYRQKCDLVIKIVIMQTRHIGIPMATIQSLRVSVFVCALLTGCIPALQTQNVNAANLHKIPSLPHEHLQKMTTLQDGNSARTLPSSLKEYLSPNAEDSNFRRDIRTHGTEHEEPNFPKNEEIGRRHPGKTCNQTSKPPRAKRSVKRPTRHKAEPEGKYCVHVDGYYDHRFLQLVTQCPDRWTNETTRQHCHAWDRIRFKSGVNEASMLPVQDNQGTVYANVFCAICHGVTTVYPWTISLDCDSSKNVLNKNVHSSDNDLTKSSSAAYNFSDVSFLMELTETAQCEKDIFPAFWDAIESCIPDKKLNKYIFLKMMLPLSFDYGESVSPTVSFNLLINFDFKGDSHILFRTSQQVVKTEYLRMGRCDPDETYDTFHNRCRPIKCNKPFYRLMGDSCVLDGRYTSEDIDILNNPYFDEMAVMSLSINITLATYAVLNSLPDINEIVTKQIAGSLNIDEERIQNTNVTFGFQMTNGTNAEIHRLHQLTPELRRKLHMEGWDLGRYKDGVSKARSIDELVVDETEVKVGLSKNHGSNDGYNGNPPSDHSEQKEKTGERVNTKMNEEDKTKSGKNGARGETMENSSPSHPHFSTSSSPFDTTSNVDKEKSVDIGTSTVTSSNKTSSDSWDSISDVLRFITRPMTMYISFILTPNQHPKVNSQRTTVLVKKISHLIRNNSMKITVQGKQLNVSGLQNKNEFDDYDTNNKDEFCQWGRLITLGNNKFQIVEFNGTAYLHSTDDDQYYKQGLFNFFAIVTGRDSKTKTSLTHYEQFSFVCVMPRIAHADCRRIELVADEYEMNSDNDTIIFQEKQYNTSMYTVQNATSGLVEICVPPSYDYHYQNVASPHLLYINSQCGAKFEDVRKVESYLTMVLGRISVIALVVVFITYCLFSSLRTLPGCNIMNLTLALFLAELIFMEDIFVQDENMCAAVTIILHYLFLVAHFWMNVISFDVFRTFSKKERAVVSRQDSVGKRFVYFPRYFIYSWGTPLIIVSVCIFIEYSNLFSIEIGYTKGQMQSIDQMSGFRTGKPYGIGSDVFADDTDETTRSPRNDSNANAESTTHRHACWITNPVVNLLAFGAPILLIFFTNCAFFTKTILSVSRTVKMARENLNRQESSTSLGKRSGRSETLLYLRMSTVMGFTWVFGFTSAIISSVARPITTTICTMVYVNSILFTIFNISQGIFIFVGFLCNRRVMQLYIKLFFRLKRTLMRKSRTSTVYSISCANGGVDLKTE